MVETMTNNKSSVTEYQNPVIPGFHPDPSVCRVEDDYYLVCSSFEYFPGIPVFHSKDLIHWEQIGHCITRNNQLRLAKGIPNCVGIYAPTVRYMNGIFYVITTNVSYGGSDEGNFFVWTKDPYGEWSDPVWVDLPGIDPSLFFDEDGKVYYIGTYKKIYLCEIDINTGKCIGVKRDIWGGTGGSDPEGPHLYKINGWYYLLISEGGTELCHMITIARSRVIEGPYESCDRNPVLTNRSRSLPIKAVGHADLIQAHDGSWWAVCLGIRPVSYPFRHHLGRESFLCPVKWDESGWPIFGNDGTLDIQMQAECLPEYKIPGFKDRDDFDHEVLDYCWNFIYNPIKELWSLSDNKGYLTLYHNETSLDEADCLAWVGRRQEHIECRARTMLSFHPINDGEEAGLTVYMNNRHHYEIALTLKEGKRCLIVRRRIGSLWKVENMIPYECEQVVLELRADKEFYYFGFSENGNSFTEAGKGEVQYLSTEVGGRFTGNYIALYSSANGVKCDNPAKFDWFEYNSLQSAGYKSCVE